jgi:hypothetical protein
LEFELIASLIPDDAHPTKLHGMVGSKKALHSNESRASWVALRVIHLSIFRKISWNMVRFVVKGIGGREIIAGGDSFGLGTFRDGSSKTEANPTSISLSKPSEIQKSKRILKATDEFGNDGTHS